MSILNRLMGSIIIMLLRAIKINVIKVFNSLLFARGNMWLLSLDTQPFNVLEFKGVSISGSDNTSKILLAKETTVEAKRGRRLRDQGVAFFPVPLPSSTNLCKGLAMSNSTQT
ncbi:hypothetical protein V6N13_141974 [Hibiscus sabdariffa]